MIIRRRFAVIVMTAGVIAAFGAGIGQVRHTTDSRVFFGERNAQRLAFEALEARFTETNDLLMVLAPADGNVFSRRTLGAVAYLTGEAWQIPFAARVDSLTNFQYSRADGDDIEIGDLVPADRDLSDRDLAAIKRIALADPMLHNLIISEAGDVTGLAVNLIYPDRDPQSGEQAAQYARALAARLEAKYPGISVYLTGGVMISDAFTEATGRDLLTLFPVMLAVIAAMLAVLLRSWAGMALALGIAASAALAALGIAGWLGIILNPGSAAAPTIVLTLAVANSVHILTAFFDMRSEGGRGFRSVIRALEVNLWPVFLTSATTAIGFISLNASESPPFRDLGNLVVAGVVLSFVGAVTFLPAVASTFPGGARPSRRRRAGDLMLKLHGFVSRRRRLLLWGGLGLSAVLMTGLARIELNDSWVDYFDESFALRRDTDFTRARLTGVNVVEYVVESGRQDGIYDPGYLDAVDQFAGWALARPEVVNVRAITQIMKRLNRNFHGDDPVFNRLPENADLAAQYLLVYEMSMPFGLDLNDRIDVAKSASRVSLATRGLSSRELRAFDALATARLAELTGADPPRAGAGAGTGVALMFAHMSRRNISSMLGSTIFAICLVSMILILALRSPRLGLVSLVPNLLPAAAAFGLWGFLVGEVGVAISIVGAITFGIVVDDTIHLLTRYLAGRRLHGLAPDDALRFAFVDVGKALVITTLVLISGFLILVFSGFQPTWGMGILASMTIAIALLADFLLLPSLLLAVDRGPAGQ